MEKTQPARQVAIFCCKEPTTPTLEALHKFLKDMYHLCQCVAPRAGVSSSSLRSPPRAGFSQSESASRA